MGLQTRILLEPYLPSFFLISLTPLYVWQSHPGGKDILLLGWGSLTAIKATSRKISVIFYNVMTKGIDFVDEGIRQYEQKIWHCHRFVKRTTNEIFTKTSKTLWLGSYHSTTSVSSLAFPGYLAILS